MKILILHRAPLWGSGSGTYVRKIAEEFSLHNEVVIVCPEDKKLPKIKIYEVKTPFTGVFHSHPDYPKAKKYSDMTNKELSQYVLPYLMTTLQAVDQFKPDIIHVQHASFLVWIADYIKSVYKIPFVVSVHGPDLNTAIIDKRIKILTRHSLIRASKILPNSFDTKNRLLSIFGKVLRRKIRTIFPGVDLKLFPKDKKISIVNKKYHLADKKLVIYAGRLDKEKGIEYLVRAAKEIKAEVYILGGGDYKTDLEKLTKELKLKNVHFMGYLNKSYLRELREFYQRADVVVVPSTVKEALGLVILEAMACSTPVVASNIGGIPSVIKDGKTGFLVKPRSSKEIAEKVNLLLANEKLRQTMGERSRKLIEEKYTWEKAADAILNIFQKALKYKDRVRDIIPFDANVGWVE